MGRDAAASGVSPRALRSTGVCWQHDRTRCEEKQRRGGDGERAAGGPRVPPSAGSGPTLSPGRQRVVAHPRSRWQRRGPPPPPPRQRPVWPQRRRQAQEPSKDRRALFEDLGVNMK